MGVGFTEAEANLRELVEWYSDSVGEQNRNEATTRLHLIDRLLFACLGWDYEDCVAEERLGGQITDYSFYCPERIFILEAKKEGTYFELPIGEKRIIYDIQFFLRHAKDVGEAIEQAVSYCQSRGTPYGAVCNGHQLIAFLGARTDGHPPLDGKALVFDSLQSILDNFLFVWQRLSKQAIVARQLYVELAGAMVAAPPEKLSARLTDYPGYKQRNTLQTDLQILADIAIADIARLSEKEEVVRFLKECYCQSGALSQYAAVSKEILRVRYSALFQAETQGVTLSPATTKKGITPELLAKSLSRRPILLIGDVGVGKTMFIEHLYKVEAADVFSNALIFYVDFATKPTLEHDLEAFVINEFETQLLETHGIDILNDKIVRGVLHGELKRFEQTIYGVGLREKDPEAFRQKEFEFIESKLVMKDEYLNRCLTHIEKGRRKQIIVFLDNVDRRSDEFQERVFVIAQTMASNWPVAVYLSLRPETYYKSRASGTLDAYHLTAFTIGPPRVDEVVNKRLEYVINLLDRGSEIGLPERVTVKATTLRDYLQVLVYSFSKNRHLIEFLDNMCGGNIRLALDFVRAFVGSGHVDTAKILNIYNETGRYLVPLHEFLRAVMYVDNVHYSPTASEIVNLFDITSPDGREHFLSPILLAQLGRLGQQSATDGFVPITDIYSYLQDLGFNPYQINSAIDRLARRKLIEPPAGRAYENGGAPSHYRLTTIGAYYITRLMGQFQYIDAMVVDTPIVDPEVPAHLQPVEDLAGRLSRTRVFCDYLDSNWSGLADQPLVFNWPSFKSLIDRNIEYIKGKVSLKEDAPPPELKLW